ncbi:MAG: hypothetical protein ACI8PB_004922 [Desulforhopalus sp.]|jgi:hypothetical protein
MEQVIAKNYPRESTGIVAPFMDIPGVDTTFESEKSNEFQNVRIDRNSK